MSVLEYFLFLNFLAKTKNTTIKIHQSGPVKIGTNLGKCAPNIDEHIKESIPPKKPHVTRNESV